MQINIGPPPGYNSARTEARRRASRKVALEQEKTARPTAEPTSVAGRRTRAAAVWLAALGAFLLVFALYLRTLSPTVLYLQDPKLLDAVMVQMQVAVLGITHPTGYPTYLMLTH